MLLLCGIKSSLFPDIPDDILCKKQQKLNNILKCNKQAKPWSLLSLYCFQILDGITRLGGLYVQICNSGCALFQNWKAVFFCNQERPVNTVVEFGKDGKHKV